MDRTAKIMEEYGLSHPTRPSKEDDSLFSPRKPRGPQKDQARKRAKRRWDAAFCPHKCANFCAACLRPLNASQAACAKKYFRQWLRYLAERNAKPFEIDEEVNMICADKDVKVKIVKLYPAPEKRIRVRKLTGTHPDVVEKHWRVQPKSLKRVDKNMPKKYAREIADACGFSSYVGDPCGEVYARFQQYKNTIFD